MAVAAMEGRDYVLPDDVKSFANSALIHRLILVPELWMKSGAASEVIEAALASVSVPVIDGV
jgi:MoxR-like ATPase